MRAALLVLLLALAKAGHGMEPIQVSPNAYYVRGETGIASAANRGFMSNAGFVITSEGVVVFDALGTPALGQALAEAIGKLTRQPVRRVIVSHYHADHIYGLAALRGPGRQVWAHRAGRAYLGSDAARQRLAERSRTLAPWVPADMPLVEADRWLETDETFKLGGLTFRVLHFGPAHTAEDLALLVEEEGVLFVGDVMFSGRLPFVGEADTRAWIAAIDRAARFQPRVLIGGHGSASYDAAADLRFTRDYLVFLRTAMGEAARNLEDFQAVYARTDWSRFSHLPAFEAANRRNAYNTYLQMQAEEK